MEKSIAFWLLVAVTSCAIFWTAFHAAAQLCEPTPPDMLGPFYKPGAPVRSSVGKGYVLTGKVLSSADCKPVTEAKMEFWLAGPDGKYGDEFRATLYSDGSGRYKFESNFPKAYSGRPPHIHIKVTAEGFKELVTQHYPEEGKTTGMFDLVLVPAEK